MLKNWVEKNGNKYWNGKIQVKTLTLIRNIMAPEPRSILGCSHSWRSHRDPPQLVYLIGIPLSKIQHPKVSIENDCIYTPEVWQIDTQNDEPWNMYPWLQIWPFWVSMFNCWRGYHFSWILCTLSSFEPMFWHTQNGNQNHLSSLEGSLFGS